MIDSMTSFPDCDFQKIRSQPTFNRTVAFHACARPVHVHACAAASHLCVAAARRLEGRCQLMAERRQASDIVAARAPPPMPQADHLAQARRRRRYGPASPKCPSMDCMAWNATARSSTAGRRLSTWLRAGWNGGSCRSPSTSRFAASRRTS